MPFQVSFSIFKEAPGVIQYFSAGEDQNVICSPLVTLQATVIGDLTGHQIIWEQISGHAVNFTTPLNQLTVQFTPPAINDDKIFRFWIDKGTIEQQYDDINVWTTPTSILIVDVPLPKNNTSIGSYGETVGCRAPALRAMFNYPLTKEEVATCSSYASKSLAWETVCTDAGILTGYTLYKKVSGSWVEVISLPPTALRYDTVEVNVLYKLSAHFTDYNRSSTYDSNAVFFPTETDYPLLHRTESNVNEYITVNGEQNIKEIVLNSYSVASRTLVNYGITDNLTSPISVLPENIIISSYNVATRVLKECANQPIDDMTSTFLFDNTNVISYSVAGGASVGGIGG